MRRWLSSLPVVACIVFAGCSHAGDHALSDESMETGKTYAPYPTDIRPGLERLGTLDPQNVSVGDFGSAVRNQGRIASCASFGFLGMLENQMFNDRGISPDLAERFMIFSNFFQTGTLGGAPEVIAQFPTLVTNLGLLTEDAYPYAAVEANAARFDQDAAQGLKNANDQPSLKSAIEGTANDSKERSDVLQRPEFIGALPAGPYPVTLPIKATLQPGAKVPEIEFDGKIYECFSADGPGATPSEKQLKVSPRELLAMCFDLDPTAYFTCGFDLQKAGADAEANAKSTDDCAKAAEVADAVAGPWLEAYAKGLKLTLALLDQGEAVMMGVTAPASPQNILAVWSTKSLKLGGGHAVLAIGYLTYEELQNADEGSRGILANGLFDKLAALVDPDFDAKLKTAWPSDPAARRDLRVQSKLGQRMQTEGGIIVFRNSWGASLQGYPIGVDGNQAMTFDYYLKAGMLVHGRSQPRLGGVAWQPGAGPAVCPATVNVPEAASWIGSPDRLEQIKAHVRSLVVPSSCQK